MFSINADPYVENFIHTINIIKRENKSTLWIKIHDIQD